MNSFSFNKVMLCAKSGYLQWIKSPRLLIYVSAMFFFYDYATMPLLQTADITGQKLSILEIFIAIGNSGMVLLIMPVLFILLISGFSKINNNSFFFFIRTGRTNWLVAQYLQLFLMVITYLIALFIGTAFPVISKCRISSEWSNVISEYIKNFPEKRNSFAYELLPENLSNQLELPKAFIYTAILGFFYLFLIGSIMILFSTIGKSQFGEVFAGGIVVTGTALCAIKSKMKWKLPAANATTKLHYTQFLREPVYPLYRSILYFILVILSIIIITFILNKKNKNF